MTFWDGTRWVPEPLPPGPSRAGALRRLFGAGVEALLITLLVFGLIAGTTFAAKGNGKGNRVASACEVSGNTVSAGGLPTDEVVNFMITDASGKWGWALGISGGDYWSVQVPDRSGPTTYEFVSRTFGSNGDRYWVFATCSAS